MGVGCRGQFIKDFRVCIKILALTLFTKGNTLRVLSGRLIYLNINLNCCHIELQGDSNIDSMRSINGGVLT